MTECERLPWALRHLADLLAPALGGPAPAPEGVDADLVHLAIHRHQVGPLLHAALLPKQEGVSENLMRDLEYAYSRSTDRHARDRARLHHIGEMLTGQGLSWMALKGTPQAERLYGDPGLRPSSDIDLLVVPRDFVRAVTVLSAYGYVSSNPPAPPGPLRLAVLAAVRDVSLIAGDDHGCAVDLHRRLFLAVGRRPQKLRLTPDVGRWPTPRLDADLACYLIMHGAQSYWVRLKWLVDIVMLLAALDDREKMAVIVRAQQVGVEKSVAASLLLLHLLFPFVHLGPLASWIAAQQARPAVRKRLARYVTMIGADSNWKRSPLDNARVGMQAYWDLFEAPWTRARMIPVALLSSATRRLAGAVWRRDRALTQDDRSPEQIAAAQGFR